MLEVTFARWAATLGVIAALFVLDQHQRGAVGVVFGLMAGTSPPPVADLAFIGVKLVVHYGHLQNDGIPEIVTSTSLLVISVILVITVVASLLRARRDPQARAHTGSLRDTRERDE